MTLGSGFAASRSVGGKLYGLDACRDGKYLGSAAGPRGVGVCIARDDIGRYGKNGKYSGRMQGQA